MVIDASSQPPPILCYSVLNDLSIDVIYHLMFIKVYKQHNKKSTAGIVQNVIFPSVTF